jgi:hypothetical protein
MSTAMLIALSGKTAHIALSYIFGSSSYQIRSNEIYLPCKGNEKILNLQEKYLTSLPWKVSMTLSLCFISMQTV